MKKRKIQKRKKHVRKKSAKRLRRLSRQTKKQYKFNCRPKPKIKIEVQPKNPKKYRVFPAPKTFNFLDNTEAIIQYFNHAGNYINKRWRVLFDISEITDLSVDAIGVLLAKVSDYEYSKGIQHNGNSPKNILMHTMMVQAGFFDHVQQMGQQKYPKRNQIIRTQSKRRVHPDIAKRACLDGTRYSFGNDEIYEPLYNILIETMQNTNNHASLEGQGIYEWWLLIYKKPGTRITAYCFLDLGVGIFESIPVKKYRNLMEFLKGRPNVDLVDDLVSGKIPSKTKRPDRGKGIPQIYNLAQDPNINKSILISNDVYANFKTNQYKELKQKFSGTLWYWELSP